MILLKSLLSFIVACSIRTSYCDINRAHKVHNIVLYPDRSSWCNATRIIQIINHPGCKTVKLDNNVCVGTCFSYVVPRPVFSSPGYVRPYCDSCQPSAVVWKQVTLECDEGELKGTNITKPIEVIENCSCQTCLEKSQQDLFTETGEDIVETENNFIEDFQSNLLIDGYETIFNGNLTNSTVKIVKKYKDPEQDVFGIFLKDLERHNDKTDFGKLMQIKKTMEEGSHAKTKIKHFPENLLKSKHGCKQLEGQGPHHSSVLSKDCYETYPSGGLYSNTYSNPKLKITDEATASSSTTRNNFQFTTDEINSTIDLRDNNGDYHNETDRQHWNGEKINNNSRSTDNFPEINPITYDYTNVTNKDDIRNGTTIVNVDVNDDRKNGDIRNN